MRRERSAPSFGIWAPPRFCYWPRPHCPTRTRQSWRPTTKEQQTQRVDQDVPLATLDLFARVVARRIKPRPPF
jgi:hypothetical protein